MLGGYQKLTWKIGQTRQVTNNITLAASVEGQNSLNNLDSSEKFSLGWPNSVQAYAGKGQVVDAAMCNGSAYMSSLLWMMRNIGQAKGKQPNKPFKGSFNVRVGPNLHRAAVIAAGEKKLNQFVCEAIEEKLEREQVV